MSAVPKPYLTLAQFYALEDRAEHKSEYFDGQAFAMAGASREHNAIKDNLIGELHSQLKGGPCRTYSSDQRVRTPSGLVAYPDIVITCGKAEFDPLDRNTLVNPQVVVEVLSPSTEAYDRGRKFDHYRSLDSLQEYVLVSTDRMRIDHYVRQDDGGWRFLPVGESDADFQLATIAAKVPLQDVYAGVELSAADDAATAVEPSPASEVPR